MKKEWSQGQIQYLIDNHMNPDLSAKKIGKELGFAEGTVISKMHELDIIDTYREVRPIPIWTQEREDFLRDNIETMSLRQLSKELGKSVSAIGRKASILGVKRNVAEKYRWKEEDVEFLKKHYYTWTVKRIAHKLGRGESTIQAKVVELGLVKKSAKSRNWTKDEDDYLKENFDKMNYEEMTVFIKRPVKKIRERACHLGLTKIYHRNRRKLKDSHIQFIIEHYKTHTDTELARMFNVSDQAIADVRLNYGIKKTGNEVLGPTTPEKLTIELLDSLGISYIYNEFLGEYKPDFQIDGRKLLIEVQGDYFHCNPKLYPSGPKDDIQINHVLSDYYKKCYYISQGYEILYIWEYDILNDFKSVKEIVESAVRGRKSPR